jgi:hypothetical protein
VEKIKISWGGGYDTEFKIKATIKRKAEIGAV